jgi:hypothetical protein
MTVLINGHELPTGSVIVFEPQGGYTPNPSNALPAIGDIGIRTIGIGHSWITVLRAEAQEDSTPMRKYLEATIPSPPPSFRCKKLLERSTPSGFISQKKNR